jgi:hypothetical protein
MALVVYILLTYAYGIVPGTLAPGYNPAKK